MEDKVFYVGQKAFIDKEGEVLVLFDPQLTFSGLDFPGGKVRHGENVSSALQREVREETGLEIRVGDPFVTWMHEFPADGKRLGSVYLVGFRCVYVSGEVRLSEEHTKYRWVNKENFEELRYESEYFRALKKYFQEI